MKYIPQGYKTLMQEAKRGEVDEVIEEETHWGDTFAKVKINGEVGWVKLLEDD